MNQTPQSLATTRRVHANGIDLHVTGYGDRGPELLLIHGIGSRGVSFWPVVDRLASDFRLIIPDLRGHGASDKPAHGYLLSDYAADLAGLIEACELKRPLIIGHSLGGLIAWQWAGKHPSRAAKIVIEDSPLHGGPEIDALFDGWIAFASLSPAEAAERYQEEHPDWSWDDCLRRAESITSTNLGVFTELRAVQAQPGEDRFGPIARIQTPTLLIYGEESAGGMVTAEEARRFVEIAPCGLAIQIPGGSHSLHRDFSDAFLDVAIPFLKA